MFDRIKQVAREVALRVVVATRTLVRGAVYDSASTTHENSRHWQNANNADTHPINDNTPDTRRKLRLRARYEEKNNSFCSGVANTIATDTVGSVLPMLEFGCGNPELSQFVQSYWVKWANAPAVNLHEKLKTLMFTKVIDGESFANFVTDYDETYKETGVTLNVVPVAASRVRDVETSAFASAVQTYNGRRVINDDGVIVSALTAVPIAFRVVDIEDEIDGYAYNPRASYVPATQMVQLCAKPYSGQLRGVCELAQGLDLFGQLRRYGKATLSSAEIAALMTMFISTNLPPDEAEQTAAITPFSVKNLERGTVTALPEGWSPTFPNASQPTTAYNIFQEAILREIGRKLDVPFGIMAGDHSRYNYSSARLDVTGYDERKRYDRSQLVVKLLNRLAYDLCVEISLQRPELYALIRSNAYTLKWRFAHRPSIDPLKDANADDVRLANGSTTLTEVYASRGIDVNEAFTTLQSERAEMRRRGIELARSPIATQPIVEPIEPVQQNL